MKPTGLGDCPEEVLRKVLKYLGKHDLLSMMRVSKTYLDPAAEQLYSTVDIDAHNLALFFANVQDSIYRGDHGPCGRAWKQGMANRIKGMLFADFDRCLMYLQRRPGGSQKKLEDILTFVYSAGFSINLEWLVFDNQILSLKSKFEGDAWYIMSKLPSICRPRHICLQRWNWFYFEPGDIHKQLAQDLTRLHLSSTSYHDFETVTVHLSWPSDALEQICHPGKINRLAVDFSNADTVEDFIHDISDGLSGYIESVEDPSSAYRCKENIRWEVLLCEYWSFAQLCDGVMDESETPAAYREATDARVQREITREVIRLYPGVKGRLKIYTFAETAHMVCEGCGCPMEIEWSPWTVGEDGKMVRKDD